MKVADSSVNWQRDVVGLRACSIRMDQYVKESSKRKLTKMNKIETPRTTLEKIIAVRCSNNNSRETQILNIEGISN